MKIILLGPPGAGKGTQAARVAARKGLPKVSSGDLFRDHQIRDTGLGRMARSYMEKGVLVPDEVTINMVMDWIGHQTNGRGYLLDGFPRTLAQAQALDGELSEQSGLDKAVYIRVSQQVLVRRIGGRLFCQGCQAPYHKEFNPPRHKDSCDTCCSHLFQREDDKPGAVEKRFEVYREQTEPLIEHYRRASVLAEVSGEGNIDEVTEALLGAIWGK